MLVSVGRAPLVEGLGLEELGVTVDRRKRDRRRRAPPDDRARTSTRSATAPATGSSRTPRSARARSPPRTRCGHDAVDATTARMPRPIYTDPEIAASG